MRVSTVNQNEDRQRLELEAWNIPLRNIYMDKLSGKDFNHPQYQRMKKRLKKNDLLIVKSIDRLGRNYHDIQKEWQMLSYVAETEHVNIRQRQKEGIAATRLKGVHLGHYPDPIPESFFPVYEKWEKRIITGREAAESLCDVPRCQDTFCVNYREPRYAEPITNNGAQSISRQG